MYQSVAEQLNRVEGKLPIETKLNLLNVLLLLLKEFKESFSVLLL